MSTNARIGIVAALVLVIGLVLATKQAQRSKSGDTCCPAVAALTAAAETNASRAAAAIDPKNLPRLLDLGADKCVPCKMIAPILAEFERDYAGQFTTEFIDVWKDSAPAKEYGIRAIPTQIFFDAEGKELFRHEGFFGKDDMFNKWKEPGVEIRSPATTAN